MPGPIDYRQMVGGLLGLLQPVGDVLPFVRRNPGFLNLTEGARPYMGGPNTIPPEARISDVPGFGGPPLTRGQLAADAQLNAMMRDAFVSARKSIKDPQRLDAITDQIFSASVRPNALYELSLLRQKLGF